ncbi:MAG: phosphate acyltransferase PlsX [Bacteroidetes bacterium]|nr:phosphate acyltransferase PlsX [Bacteroidota bacterium]
MKIGLDIMGGDFATEATTEGAILALNELPPGVKLVLIGNSELFLPILEKANVSPDNFEIVHTTEVIGMGEHPTKAFTQKTGSSIAAGFSLLKEKKIDAFASAGNTGAMLVGSLHTVKSISGVIRPCITSLFPKEDGSFCVILDVGANADCKPDVLYQFGYLGSLYSKHIFNIENPSVALLNIGVEEKKGNLLTQAAHELMKDSKDFKFIGNIEGRDIFDQNVDVIVCDGFTGNVVLKEAEAFFALIKKRGIKDNYFDKFNYELYGGTPILGINSNVIIGHGISNKTAIKNMVLLCKNVVEARLSDKIKEAFI